MEAGKDVILEIEIQGALNRNEQVMILLNRRGYSTFLSCTNCGYVYKCPNCDISLIYHKSSKNYSCHYCGYRTFSSEVCPSCHENAIKDLGLGTEKLEDIIAKKYNVNTKLLAELKGLEQDDYIYVSRNSNTKVVEQAVLLYDNATLEGHCNVINGSLGKNITFDYPRGWSKSKEVTIKSVS